jgi:hypothetical protein
MVIEIAGYPELNLFILVILSEQLTIKSGFDIFVGILEDQWK